MNKLKKLCRTYGPCVTVMLMLLALLLTFSLSNPQTANATVGVFRTNAFNRGFNAGAHAGGNVDLSFRFNRGFNRNVAFFGVPYAVGYPVQYAPQPIIVAPPAIAPVPTVDPGNVPLSYGYGPSYNASYAVPSYSAPSYSYSSYSTNYDPAALAYGGASYGTSYSTNYATPYTASYAQPAYSVGYAAPAYTVGATYGVPVVAFASYRGFRGTGRHCGNH